MKNISRVFALAIMIVFATPLLAVAPLPELGLKEPIYPRAPFTLAGHSAKRIAQREANEHLAQRGLLIVVEFADQRLAPGNTIQSFDSLFNGNDYNYNGATGSCKKYFEAQSNGLYSPHQNAENTDH